MQFLHEPVQCVLVYGVRCTVYSVRCTVYGVRCTCGRNITKCALRPRNADLVVERVIFRLAKQDIVLESGIANPGTLRHVCLAALDGHAPRHLVHFAQHSGKQRGFTASNTANNCHQGALFNLEVNAARGGYDIGL